ncbi:glycosyltransferase family 4 protein [Lactiplantibacillus plantarum]|uniref:glycosyltransferase family 4 protein n=1 Tax=Lactiplantibacillus plantarum TaxID=1590 RepID=UPI001897A303|nr:glycosyltransferase family 4 protein [Lactiplantibacillus plantarum]
MNSKVLILCQYFYPDQVSSATLPVQFAEDLAKTGTEVHVYCGYPQEYYKAGAVSKTELHKGINIHRVQYTKFNNKSKVGRLLNFFSFFNAILLRLPQFFSFKKIVVYSNPPILPFIAYLIQKLSGAHFMFVLYDVYPENAILIKAVNKTSILVKVMNYMNKRIYKSAARIIALGTEMQDFLIYKKNVAKEKITVVPNWYDGKQVLEKVNNKEFLKLRSRYRLVLLYSGNMGLMQDMKVLIHTAKLLKNNDDICFIFCGGGKKFNTVKENLQKENLSNCYIYEYLTGSDYSDVLQITDVALMTLIDGATGLGVPSKSYGYLAAKKPIIAQISEVTDIARDLQSYHAGIIARDAEQFVTNILDLLESKEKINAMSLAAYQLFCDKYTRDINTAKYINLVKKL